MKKIIPLYSFILCATGMLHGMQQQEKITEIKLLCNDGKEVVLPTELEESEVIGDTLTRPNISEDDNAQNIIPLPFASSQDIDNLVKFINSDKEDQKSSGQLVSFFNNLMPSINGNKKEPYSCAQLVPLLKSADALAMPTTFAELTNLYAKQLLTKISQKNLTAADMQPSLPTTIQTCIIQKLIKQKPEAFERLSCHIKPHYHIQPVYKNDYILRKQNINCLAFHPNPKEHLLASTAEDGSIKLWNTQTGALVKNMEYGPECEHAIRTLAFHPNQEKYLLASVRYCFHGIRVWDTQTGRWIKTLRNQDPTSGPIVFHPNPDGNLIASTSNKKIQLWDVHTAECSKMLDGHDYNVATLAFPTNHDTHVLASSGEKTIKIWDIQTGTCTQSLQDHKYHVSKIAFHPDHHTNILASSDGDGVVRLWDLRTGTNTPILVAGNPASIIRFTPNVKEHILAYTDKKGAISFWDCTSNRCIRTWQYDICSATALAFSPNQKEYLLATGTEYGHVLLWNFNPKLNHLENHLYLEEATFLAALNHQCKNDTRVTVNQFSQTYPYFKNAMHTRDRVQQMLKNFARDPEIAQLVVKSYIIESSTQ